jgi:hypothetical protein
MQCVQCQDGLYRLTEAYILHSAPSFRRDFGGVIDKQYVRVLSASWQSVFTSISSIGGMVGAFTFKLGCVSELLGRVCRSAVFDPFARMKQTTWRCRSSCLYRWCGELINGFPLGLTSTGTQLNLRFNSLV